MATTFSFSLPVGDSASLALVLPDAPSLSGWAVTFTAGSVVKTSALGQVTIGTPTGGVTVAIAAGNFSTVGTIPASVVATFGAQQLTWYGSIVITSASTVDDLTTIEKVRNFLFGSTAPTESDALLAQFITSSSAWITAKLGHSVLPQSLTEVRNGDGTDRMILNEAPVYSVTSVTIDGDTISERTVVGDPGWVLIDDGITLIGYTFTQGVANVEIVYASGDALVPPDLELAVLKHVGIQYRDRAHLGMASGSVGGESATFSNAGEFAYIEGVIDLHRQSWGFA